MYPTTVSTNGSGSAGGSRCRSLSTSIATMMAVVAASVAGLGFASAPAMADECPNAAVRAQSNSAQLPDCRAYELVTPVFKEGFSPVPIGVTDDGRLTFITNGNYAGNGNGTAGLPGGNTYLAARGGSGWGVEPLAPGPDYYTYVQPSPRAITYSSDQRSSLWVMRRSDQTNAVLDLYVRRPDDSFIRIGSAVGAETSGRAPTQEASDDLSHIAFTVLGQGTNDGTYEFIGTGDDQPRLVSVDNAGQPLAPTSKCASTEIGWRNGSYQHAISADGRVIFFTCLDPVVNSDSDAVYARVGGTTTIEVSASQCTRTSSDPGGPCNAHSGVYFQGANADGTRVYLTTSQQLINSDTDETTDLYECDIPLGTQAPIGTANPCPDLRLVSGAATGADVQGVTRLSDDGSRAYFVATGVLASNLDAKDAPPVAGDHNLYVWTRDAAHSGGDTRFVAKLDPAADGASLNGLWNNDSAGRLAQTTDDGRYLVFGTYAPLIDHGPQADTDSARDIYRYDADTGALTRLSTDADGQGGNKPGADANFTISAHNPASAATRSPRTAMSDDGGSVVFHTSDALTPSDTNGTVDVYLWQQGRVSLISSGKPSDDQALQFFTNQPLGTTAGGIVVALISPSGRDVYFETTARLVSSDIDSLFDIYDARVDGGFDLSTTPACSEDACQGPPSTPPPAKSPGSTSSTGQGRPSQTTPTFTIKKPTARQLARVVSTGKVALSVVTNAPGVLSAQATARIAQRPSSVGSAKRKVASAGSLTLSLTLSKKARAELKRKRKLTVKVRVSQDNVAIARTVSLKLTQPKPATKKAKRKASRTTSSHVAMTRGQL